MEEFNNNLEKAKKILIEKTKCSVIILFGSFYRGDQTAESDVDIAIRPRKELESKDIFELTGILEGIFGREVDLIDLNNIQDGFRYEILINGKVIYCEDEYAFEQYRLDMFREYLELNESRQEIINKMKNGE